MDPTLSRAKEVLQLLVSKWKLVLASSGIDIVFILIFGQVFGYLNFRVMVHLDNLLQIVGDETGGIANSLMGASPLSTADFAANPLFVENLSKIFYNIMLIVVSVYILFVLFQGANWYIAYLISEKSGKKEKGKHLLPFKRFALNFFLESMLFYIIFVIFAIVFVKFYMSIGLATGTFSKVPYVKGVAKAFLVVLIYFALLTFASAKRSVFKNIKSGLLAGTRRILTTGPSIAFLFILFVVIDLVLRALFNLSFMLAIPLGIIILMPVFAFSRVLLIRTAR